MDFPFHLKHLLAVCLSRGFRTTPDAETMPFDLGHNPASHWW
jgi:hypothetical protein